MSIKRFFQTVLAVCLGLILVMTVLLFQLHQANQQLTMAGDTRYQSYQLASEFKQSSDDLTRMARLYVVTRDPLYKEIHHSILDIRNGITARPDDYRPPFWDFVVANTDLMPADTDAQPVALWSLMEDAGFNTTELEMLARARAISDEQTQIELMAFDIIDSLNQSSTGQIGRDGLIEQVRAISLLFSDDYLQQKAGLLGPVKEMLRLLDARTTNQFDSVSTRSSIIIGVVSAVALALLTVVICIGYMLFKYISDPILSLNHRTQRFAKDLSALASTTSRLAHGDHSGAFAVQTERSHASERNEIGELNRQFDSMIGSLENAGADITRIIGDLEKRAKELHDAYQSIQEQNQIRRVGEIRYRSLVLATSQIVWHTDHRGLVTSALPSWQEYTGQSESEVMGTGWATALHPDDVNKSIDAWNDVVNSKSIFTTEYRIRRHDGVYQDFTVNGAPVIDDDGEISEWIGTCTNITDKKKAEEERDRFFTLSLDLMCVASTDGYFRRLNPAFEATLGYTEEELLSAPFLDFVYPDDLEPTLEVMQSLRHGEVLINFENRYRCKDQSYRWFLWTCVPDDENGLLYAAARDITHIKQKEEEISQLNAELEQRVAERTVELQHSNKNLVSRTQQLEESNKELEAFTYSVSHDLRAPLRGIDGYSRILKEDFGDVLGDEGNRLLGVVCNETQRMGQLIDDLLNFSRIGRKQLNIGLVDMHHLVREVIDGFSRDARQNTSNIDLAQLPAAQGDRAMLRQVFINLIGNALKFTAPATSPLIQIDYQTCDDRIVYYVKDNGAGFDPRYINKLFGVFQRLHSSHEFEGTGVGLALVQRIIHRHGGQVWAEGQPGQGATFYFSLPLDLEK